MLSLRKIKCHYTNGMKTVCHRTIQEHANPCDGSEKKYVYIWKSGEKKNNKRKEKKKTEDSCVLVEMMMTWMNTIAIWVSLCMPPYLRVYFRDKSDFLVVK